MVRYNEDVDKDSCQVMGQGCQQLEKGIIIDTVLEIKDIKKVILVLKYQRFV